MKVVDSSGWVEFAAGGPLAGHFEKHLRDLSQLITPSIIVFEVYRRLKKGSSEHAADEMVVQMKKTQIIPFDDSLAVQAAEASLKFSLPMADAIVYATAQAYHATLVTGDADFKNLPGVIYIK